MRSNNKEKIRKEFPAIREKVGLARYSSYRIGGAADLFFDAESSDDFVKIVKAAKKNNLPFFVLGGGSNVLFGDKGFRGLVVRTKFSSLNVSETESGGKITAEAGAKLGDLAAEAREHSLAGLEWAAGIPGTVGGAIRGNAGAGSGSMKDVVKTVNVLDLGGKDCEIKTFENIDCRFDYRSSVFKTDRNLIVLSCEIRLEAGDPEKIKKITDENMGKRKTAQPLNFPSAGSVFKNPSGDSAGRLIEECGLKGKKVGGVAVSQKHANFIVNLGKGKSDDVIELIRIIKTEVKKKSGIELEEEIEIVK